MLNLPLVSYYGQNELLNNIFHTEFMFKPKYLTFIIPFEKVISFKCTKRYSLE